MTERISYSFCESLRAQQAAADFRALTSRESFVVKKRSKKAKTGFTEVDVIPLIEAVEAVESAGDTLHLTLLLNAQNPGLNPDVLLRGFLEEYPALPLSHSACHRIELLDEVKQVYR